MNRRSALIALIAVPFVAGAVRAELINVPTIGTINMLPNTQSAYQTISVNDLNPGSAQDFVGWSLGFRIVPLAGATGTVTIDSSTLYPDSDNVFPSVFPAAAPSKGTDSPTLGDVTLSASESSGFGVTVPGGAGKNLMKLRFNASSDASGDFALQLVDNGNLENTFWTWTDGIELFESRELLVGGADFVSGIQLGTISLPMAAIPEPSSLALCGAVVAFISGRRIRGRKKVLAINDASA